MRRFFLVGCPRSGTTLLQSMLGTHRDVATFTESHIFPEEFSPKPFYLYRVRHTLPDRIREFLKENELLGRVTVPSVRTGLVPRPFAVAEARKCLKLFDDMALATSKTAWLEKTPRNLHRISLLEKSDPNIEVIHIVRDPASVVSSLHKAANSWGVPMDHPKAAARWLHDMNVTFSYQGSAKHLFLLYEDLVRNPERIVAHLVRQLGLDLSHYQLDNYKQVAARVTTPEESWKANNVSEIGVRPSNRDILIPAIQELIERDLQPLYQRACGLWRLPA